MSPDRSFNLLNSLLTSKESYPMLQERIEGKWLASFRRVFALNGIGKVTTVALIYETQSRSVLAHLSQLALYELSADFCMLKMVSPPQTVPVKGTGTSLAIQGYCQIKHT